MDSCGELNKSSGASRSIKDEDIGMAAAGFIFLAQIYIYIYIYIKA